MFFYFEIYIWGKGREDFSIAWTICINLSNFDIIISEAISFLVSIFFYILQNYKNFQLISSIKAIQRNI